MEKYSPVARYGIGGIEKAIVFVVRVGGERLVWKDKCDGDTDC